VVRGSGKAAKNAAFADGADVADRLVLHLDDDVGPAGQIEHR